MPNITFSASALVAKFRYALDNKWGYIYGKCGQIWTEANQKAATREMTVKYGRQWIGHHVADCSGLFVWAFKELGGYIYHGSNTMYRDYCTEKGQLSGGKRTDGKELLVGTALFTGSENDHGHVALYIGSGLVIEAHGTKKGVIQSSLSDKRWTYWGTLKGVEYNNNGGDPVPEPSAEKGYALVTGKRVALRTAPSKQANIIMRIDTGKTVKLETPPPSEWDYVSYEGKTGYMMKEFLKEG